jgi:hypothetical protein
LGLSFFALLIALMSSVGARADFLYTFSGENFVEGGSLNTFSFTESSLITTTGAFPTSFDIDGTTFTHGFFDASSDCFAFSTLSVSCGSFPNVDSFSGTLPGATKLGTFASSTSTCQSFEASGVYSEGDKSEICYDKLTSHPKTSVTSTWLLFKALACGQKLFSAFRYNRRFV